MWTPEQQEEIQRIARETIPGIKTAAIPRMSLLHRVITL